MGKKLVYVASAISKGCVVSNIKRAHQAGIDLLKAGLSVIVPHGSCFWGNKMGRVVDSRTDWFGFSEECFIPEPFPAGTTHSDWMGVDLEIVRRCDAVLRLPGESVGADMEAAEARKHDIPVFQSVGEVVDWASQE